MNGVEVGVRALEKFVVLDNRDTGDKEKERQQIQDSVDALADTFLIGCMGRLQGEDRLDEGEDGETLGQRVAGEKDHIFGEDGSPDHGDEDDSTKLGDDTGACQRVVSHELKRTRQRQARRENNNVPRTRFFAMNWPGGCWASPGRPSRGSNSPWPWLRWSSPGGGSGSPVAEDMFCSFSVVYLSESGLI